MFSVWTFRTEIFLWTSDFEKKISPTQFTTDLSQDVAVEHNLKVHMACVWGEAEPNNNNNR